MRVCDRHNRKPAKDTIFIESSDTSVDLCAKCIEQITQFISNSRQDEVEKPKRNILGLKKNSA